MITLNKKIIEKHIKPLFPIPTEINPSGQPSHPVQCVLFDVYGTLFISDSGDIGVAKSKAQQHTKIQKLLTKHRIDMTAAHLFDELYRHIER